MAKKRVNMTIEESILIDLDKKRGLIPRSRFIECLIKETKEDWIKIISKKECK
jgi:hypothetical protein